MSKKGESSKLYDDKKIREYASAFFYHASSALCKTEEEAIEALRSLEFTIQRGKYFNCTPDVARSLANLVQICTKKLGAKSGHETDIERIAWEIASTMDPNDIASAVKDFALNVEKQSRTEFIYIAPNFTVELLDNIEALEVGPVKIRKSSTLPDDYVKASDRFKWIFHPSSSPQIIASFEGLNILYPDFCWEVKLNSSPGNVEEEAFWLISIALSCIRLFYPLDHINPSYPRWGNKESHPTNVPVVSNPRIIIHTQNRKFDAGGVSAPLLYTIDNKVLEHFKQRGFEKFTETIFNYKKNTVAERVAHGLGWLTRGRHSEDRSERFLFFYTAIEALVSAGDKSAPVIQTIARNAASILSDSHEIRREVAKDIITAYDFRSSLVHGCRRQVSLTQSYKAQQLAEYLYHTVITHIDLSMNNEDFENALREASYGMPLPTKKII